MPASYEESSLRVLRLLEKNPQLTQRELAMELGVSLGKVNYCVHALLAKCFIKLQNFRGSRKNRLCVFFDLVGLCREKQHGLEFSADQDGRV
ncbi:winged helix-turn-helix transcriptional regulator [Rhodoferax sp.]|uniref:winged helix-turn-helix transcriptional regulator n=1 Tax=Rhodoferax sp. TaxID=50421 RepID=UPI0025DDA504|nr:winged helix-turn-helix transcriptional regulator [Rhodoferax sp.]